MADNGSHSDQDEAADVECLLVLCSVLRRMFSLQPIAKITEEYTKDYPRIHICV